MIGTPEIREEFGGRGLAAGDATGEADAEGSGSH